MKKVMILTGAGQIGMAIVRRMGYGMKIVVGDKNPQNAQRIAKIMNDAGFDVTPVEMDLSSRESIQSIIAEAQKYGDITMLVNAAGVSPSQASIETILKVDLYGTAVLLEEVGKVIAPGGAGVTISSQSGHRMKQLTPEEDMQLACTPAEELLQLPLLQPENIPCTHTSSPSTAMKSVSWRNQSSGAQGALELTPSLQASLLHRWPSTSLTAREGNFTKICLPNVPLGDPVQRMRSLMWRNC